MFVDGLRKGLNMKALMLMLVIGFWGGFVDCFGFLAYDIMISC